MIRVSIVEDDVAFQQELATAIEAAPDMQLLWTAGSVGEARRSMAGEAADVLVVDLGLPDGSGLEVITHAHESWPGCAVVVATVFGDEMHVVESIEAGASGYLLKNNYGTSARLTDDIRSLNDGGSPISPMIARYVLSRFRQGTKRETSQIPADTGNGGAVRTADEGGVKLSARELEVLRLITKGFTYDEVGQLMKISRYTVMNFVRRIYGKLEVHSKIEAIHEARSQGLLDNV